MVDTLLAVLAVAVLVVLAVAVLLAVTVGPLLVALSHAARLRASSARIGGATVAGVAVCLLLALVAVRSGSTTVAAVPLVGTWLVPVAVAWSPAGSRALGRSGRHERLAR